MSVFQEDVLVDDNLTQHIRRKRPFHALFSAWNMAEKKKTAQVPHQDWKKWSMDKQHKQLQLIIL